MKSPIAFLFLLLVSSVAGYARPSFVTPSSLRKSDPQRLLRRQNEYNAAQPKVRATVSKPTPEAIHNTHRVELPGKHKDGPWFTKNQHKKEKNNKKGKDNNGSGGRAFTYGKVPRW
eukprot:CAMPEP_0113644192 /NCGR_PEP_ID=MMETSP0017_2-20120614/23253_1 /TAXON_ID=2856 /ORGANISM="Cylindrotheca closterium" /LENGTH=115 /DNA_ID=CAMNT_0000555779 /DNA_START=16 /DNA_END=363 /DNA_ORIENTATION=+ /assembly_acc=CAM_ASM_000147